MLDKVIRRCAMVFIGLAAMPDTALACIDIAPFEISDISSADLVVAGELAAYAKVSHGGRRGLSDYAILTVRVQSTLKGEAPRMVQLTWDNSTFSEPEMMVLGEKVIVAAVRPGGAGLPLRGPSATVLSAPRPDKMQVLQAPCAPAFILPYSAQSEKNLRAILRGEPVGEFNFHTGGERLYKFDSSRWL